jgi:GNAT superfamily N-acetyltransferase
MIELQDWTRYHRSQLERWLEPSKLLPAFTLRADDEPWNETVTNYALLAAGSLLGRFSFRSAGSGVAFFGLVLAPAARGYGYSRLCLRAALCRLASNGFVTASASVAVANEPSVRMLNSAGLYPVRASEWRPLPAGFDVTLLLSLPGWTYRIGVPFEMLYRRMQVGLDWYMYAEEAQQSRARVVS